MNSFDLQLAIEQKSIKLVAFIIEPLIWNPTRHISIQKIILLYI